MATPKQRRELITRLNRAEQEAEEADKRQRQQDAIQEKVEAYRNAVMALAPLLAHDGCSEGTMEELFDAAWAAHPTDKPDPQRTQVAMTLHHMAKSVFKVRQALAELQETTAWLDQKVAQALAEVCGYYDCLPPGVRAPVRAAAADDESQWERALPPKLVEDLRTSALKAEERALRRNANAQTRRAEAIIDDLRAQKAHLPQPDSHLPPRHAVQQEAARLGIGVAPAPVPAPVPVPAPAPAPALVRDHHARMRDVDPYGVIGSSPSSPASSCGSVSASSCATPTPRSIQEHDDPSLSNLHYWLRHGESKYADYTAGPTGEALVEDLEALVRRGALRRSDMPLNRLVTDWSILGALPRQRFPPAVRNLLNKHHPYPPADAPKRRVRQPPLPPERQPDGRRHELPTERELLDVGMQAVDLNVKREAPAPLAPAGSYRQAQ